MKNYLRFAAVLPLFALAVPALAVTTVSQTVALPTWQPSFSPISFNKFDSSLGTLTSVELSFETVSTTSVKFSNNSNSVRNWTVTPDAYVNLTGNGFFLSDSENNVGQNYSLAKRISTHTPRTGTGSFSETFSDTDTLTSGLGNFLGTGTIGFLLSQWGDVDINGAQGQHAKEGKTSFLGNATIRYNYEAILTEVGGVPEPGTWAMMIVGFGFIGASMRSRRGSVPRVSA